MSCMGGNNSEEKPRVSNVISSSTTGIGYHHHHHQSMHNNNNHFQSSFDPSEMYNLTANMEMMIGFPSKNLHPQYHGASSSSKDALNEDYNYQNGTMMVSATDHHSWINSNNDQSCVFPCEGNERPSQGLSLSLNSSNPSSIGLQSFELRHQNDDLRFGPSSSRSVNIQQQGGGLPLLHDHVQFHVVRNSKYLGPVQELLKEFCNLGTKQIDENLKMKKSNEWEQDEINGLKKQTLYSSFDLLELQKRKSKLLHMLEEVDRRYKHYCDQMKSVVSSFEAVAGNGAAKVYSALASRAMSRHFRCLRDGIVSEIKATKKAMGEKDSTSNAALGTSKGETPRLRLLDQTLRQQKAFQQMTMIESHPWRPQRGLPERSVSNWFINARVRLWKPMVEEMYLEELKEHGEENDENQLQNQINHSRINYEDDQKPSHEQLTRNMDSECLSSIINHNSDRNKNRSKSNEEEHFGRVMDFSSYNHHSAGGAVSYNYGGGGGGGVSLTLGLHQHGGNGGVSLAFSPASQGSLFYPRENNNNNKNDAEMEDCQTVQEYSLLESDQNQNLPYRNLMGAQLLRDFAG
ncbi:hypothetical protein RD792_004068 [Penstemon davidsonii]|uniref:POX domain-containing protein n=1 Tax=Penstemon davidsonii TaxID=160366 RepID=A0ABR0DGJ7_9LAMI|nr:hypothetical protein RD792_004068 [Penstemon davidsonii]